MQQPSHKRRAELDGAFKRWSTAKNEREREVWLVCLWELCRPEIRRAVKELATAENVSMKSWLKRRGLGLDEVSYAAFPAVKDAATRYDPAHASGASFSTFAMKYIKGEVARTGRDFALGAGAAESPGGRDVKGAPRQEAELHPEKEPLDFAHVVEMVHRHTVAEIAQSIYRETKYPHEHLSQELHRCAAWIEEEYAQELKHDVKLLARR